MLFEYFNNEASSDLWLTYEQEIPVSIAYVAPEKMTEGTWNIYLIAVHPDFQSQGIGTVMIEKIEKLLTEKGERILLVETSGLDSFAKTRSFYDQCAFQQEAKIRDFYQAGEDKIVFRKSLIATGE